MKDVFFVKIAGAKIDFQMSISDSDSIELLEEVVRIIQNKNKIKKWLQKPIVLFDPKTHYLKKGKPVKRPKLRI